MLETIAGVIKNKAGKILAVVVEESIPQTETTQIVKVEKNQPKESPIMTEEQLKQLSVQLDEAVQKAWQDAKAAQDKLEELKRERAKEKPSTLDLHKMSVEELKAACKDGKISVIQLAEELEFRKKNPELFKTVTKNLQASEERLTAEKIGMAAKYGYLSEVEKARIEAIKKAETVKEFDAIAELMVKPYRTLAEKQRIDEEIGLRNERLEKMWGSAEAVAKELVNYTNAPKPSPEAQAQASLQNMAANGDAFAKHILKQQADDELKKSNPHYYQIRKFQESQQEPDEDEIAAQWDWINRNYSNGIQRRV